MKSRPNTSRHSPYEVSQVHIPRGRSCSPEGAGLSDNATAVDSHGL